MPEEKWNRSIACPLFRGSKSLGLSSWRLIFLSSNEKCWLLLTTSERFFHKNFVVNHSGRLFFCPLFEGVRHFECPVFGGFTVITKLISTRLIVVFIN